MALGNKLDRESSVLNTDNFSKDTTFEKSVDKLLHFIMDYDRLPMESDGKIYEFAVSLKNKCMLDSFSKDKKFYLKENLAIFLEGSDYSLTDKRVRHLSSVLDRALGGTPTKEDKSRYSRKCQIMLLLLGNINYVEEISLKEGVIPGKALWSSLCMLFPNIYNDSKKNYLDLMFWALCSSWYGMRLVILNELNTLYSREFGTSNFYSLGEVENVVNRYISSGRLDENETKVICHTFGVCSYPKMGVSAIMQNRGIGSTTYYKCLKSARDKMRDTLGLNSAVTMRYVNDRLVSKLNYELREGKVPSNVILSGGNSEYTCELDRLGLPARVTNAMKERNITTVNGFLRYCSNIGNLWAIPGIGQISVRDTMTVLRGLGYNFNERGFLVKL